MPSTRAPAFSIFLNASRNPHASIVQPGVSALGKKNSTTVCPLKSLRETFWPSSFRRVKSGALSLTSMQSPFLRPAKAASDLYNGVPYYIMRRISWVLVCSVGLLIFCSGAAAKTRKGPRAIAVLEWEGDPKSPKPHTSVLVPITILDEGKYYDASIYRASPVPMAIDSGVVYDILKSGELVGTFVTGASSQQKNRW